MTQSLKMLLINKIPGWRDASAAKIICSPAEEWSSVPQTHSRQITTAYDSTSREPTALFWFLWVHVRVCTAHRHTHVINKYKIKLFKRFKYPQVPCWLCWNGIIWSISFSPFSLFICSNSNSFHSSNHCLYIPRYSTSQTLPLPSSSAWKHPWTLKAENTVPRRKRNMQALAQLAPPADIDRPNPAARWEDYPHSTFKRKTQTWIDLHHLKS